MGNMRVPAKAKPKHLGCPLVVGCSTNQSSIHQEKELSENKVCFCYFSEFLACACRVRCPYFGSVWFWSFESAERCQDLASECLSGKLILELRYSAHSAAKLCHQRKMPQPISKRLISGIFLYNESKCGRQIHLY